MKCWLCFVTYDAWNFIYQNCVYLDYVSVELIVEIQKINHYLSIVFVHTHISGLTYFYLSVKSESICMGRGPMTISDLILCMCIYMYIIKGSNIYQICHLLKKCWMVQLANVTSLHTSNVGLNLAINTNFWKIFPFLFLFL